MPINLQSMCLDRGRTLEYPEGTPKARGEHANSTHTWWRRESNPQLWRCEANVLTTRFRWLKGVGSLAQSMIWQSNRSRVAAYMEERTHSCFYVMYHGIMVCFRGGHCPARRQWRRVPAAPSSHPPAPWRVPDPSKTDIVTPEPSFVGGCRSVRVLGGGRRSAVDVAWRCCSAVDVAWPCCSTVDVTRLCCSAVDVAWHLRSAVDVVLDPLALPSGPVLPPTCLAPASHSPHVPRLDPRSPHLPCFCFSLPPQCLALLLAPPTGLSMFLAPPQDPSLDRTFWGGL
ncbi:hypothetical protein QTP70_026464, partial [Hemibagrus guttatus]